MEDAAAGTQFGLVCITVSEAVRYRTLTRKRLLAMTPEMQTETLRRLYADNLQRLRGAIEFCSERGIKLYRLPSSLFPFADDAAGADLLEELADELRKAGDAARAAGLRLVLHPDQFVVLNSDSPQVIANSIKILSTQARIFDLLGLPRSAWAAMNIHGGKGGRGERLVGVIRDLPEAIRTRLTLENDEYTYDAATTVKLCREAGVPMVFDAHHHVCREKLSSYDDPSVGEMLAAARTTWPVPEWQLVHISNGREFFLDPRHSDLIADLPASYTQAGQTLWIEVEAKWKEQAIEKLRRDGPTAA